MAPTIAGSEPAGGSVAVGEDLVAVLDARGCVVALKMEDGSGLLRPGAPTITRDRPRDEGALVSTTFQREKDGQVFGATPDDFKNRCYTFLVVLCNDKDMNRAHGYLTPDCVLVHGDAPPVHGADAFIATWKENLEQMSDYHKDIQDMVVEMDTEHPGVARVWVYSRITGIPGAAVTDSIDMMHFSADGLFIDSKDVQRVATAS